MRNEKILEMLNNGEIEELKKAISNEIYVATLGKNGSADRYKAMKKYFKDADKNAYDKRMLMPAKVKIQGEEMTCFLDGHCLACTREEAKDIKLYEEWKDGVNYYEVGKIIDTYAYTAIADKDLSTILPEAKSKGYKYSKKNLHTIKYALKIKDAYFNIALFDKAYSIIAGGEDEVIYYYSPKSALIIKNSIGIALILPFNFKNLTDDMVVIEK